MGQVWPAIAVNRPNIHNAAPARRIPLSMAAFLKRLRAEVGPAVGGDPVLRAWFAWTEHAVDAYDPRPGTWPRSCGTSIERPGRGPSLRRDDDDLDDT